VGVFKLLILKITTVIFKNKAVAGFSWGLKPLSALEICLARNSACLQVFILSK
jgi:hypothetical protein